MDGPSVKIRLDKWLWQARFFKTRTLAAKEVSAGHVRVNGTRVSKPAQPVGSQDVLTFSQATRVRVVRIIDLGTRRGPAPEAHALYEDLSDPVTQDNVPPAPKFEGKGRPTKRDRRKLDLNGSRPLD
ncbi:RNA-binding S4 domain-containing protein [Roseovarius sp.]|uniref:RNA-binding S4 domain-containing protein n=1 Tax=Roseovarius sp. TaxID=1486281 RepID=UPI003A976B7D